MIPESGSSYTYAYATMGRFMAWFIGWNMVLEYGVSASTVRRGLVGLFRQLPERISASSIPRLRSPMRRSAGTGLQRLHLTGAFINFPRSLLVIGADDVPGSRRAGSRRGLTA